MKKIFAIVLFLFAAAGAFHVLNSEAATLKTRIEVKNATPAGLSGIVLTYTLEGAPRTETFSLARLEKKVISADRGTRVNARYGSRNKNINASGAFTRLALTQ